MSGATINSFILHDIHRDILDSNEEQRETNANSKAKVLNE